MPLLFFLDPFSPPTVQPAPATIQLLIPTFQCFSLNNLILACYHSVCLQGSILDSISYPHALSFSCVTAALGPAPIKGPNPVRTLLQSLLPTVLSPLAATLMNLPVNIANKGLTIRLNPLDATLIENRGYPLDVWTSHIRPIAAKRLWCNNSQRHGVRRWRRETYRLQPVSKRIERTSGTARSWSPLQVVPGRVPMRVSGFVLATLS